MKSSNNLDVDEFFGQTATVPTGHFYFISGKTT